MGRQTRIEENEKLFREVNERVAQMHRGFQTGSDPEWVCECGDESCFEKVTIPLDDYQASSSAHGGSRPPGLPRRTG